MTDHSNPYENLPPIAFWRKAVAEQSPLSISGLWKPKNALRKKQKIATAGSCFAQHIGRALARNGYQWFDAEPAPEAFDHDLKKAYNYGVFSFRTGNIYTTAALRQWVSWALNLAPVPEEFWEKDGRFYDPFRPAIEPDGFSSAEEMLASRRATLVAIRRAIEESNHFVFTLGLTEGWMNTEKNYVYAMCPGTLAGTFDPEVHKFQNFGFTEVMRDLQQAIRDMRVANPKLRFLLTVSPVPLTATASGEHVLTATTYSKSVLRAVAGEAASKNRFVDYFPSYEIITAPPFRGMFYEPNLRSVHPTGVDFVMKSFFDCIGASTPNATSNSPVTELDPEVQKKRRTLMAAETSKNAEISENDVVCEELLLDSFRKD